MTISSRVQPPGLYTGGRYEMLLARSKKMIETSGYVGAIDSGTGLGKSYCAGKIRDILIDNGTEETHVFLYAANETDDGYAVIEWLHNLTAEDVEPKGWKAKAVAFVRRGPVRGLGKIFKAVAKDAGAYLEAEETAEALAEYLGDSTFRSGFERAGSERLGEQIATVREKLEKSSRRYYLIVEGVERLALPGLRVLHDLIKVPPANVRIMLFTDQSWNVGKQTVALKEIIATLQQRHMTEISKLSGLTVPEIQAWYYDVRSSSLTPAAAEIAYAHSENGRPDILNSWVQSGSSNPEDVSIHGTAAWGGLKLKVDELSAFTIGILETLVCAYPMPLSFDQLQTLCSSADQTPDASIVAQAIKDLDRRGDLIKQVQGKVSCINRNICNFVKYNAGEATVNFRNGLILAATYGISSGHPALPENEMQLIPSNLQAADLNDAQAISALLGNVQHSLEHGSYGVAERLLASLESLPNNNVERWQSACRSLHAQLRADLAGQYGDFNNAIEWANKGLEVSSSPEDVIKLETSLGDKFLQLGKYRDAYYHFKRARECAFTANDTENFVIAVIQAVKVLSDISRYKSCAKILAGLAKSLPSIRVSDKTKCLAYRWIARIYVLDSDYRLEALKFAQEALTIAQRMGKERYIGNCQFVIGEVNRRLGNQSSANNAYNKALKAARISGNKDLEVYSLLGIALLSAQAGGTVFSGNLAALRQSLEYQAPIENLYLDVLETLNTLRNDTSKDPTRLDYLISQLEASRKFGLARSLKEIKNLSNNGWDQSITAFNWNNFVL